MRGFSRRCLYNMFDEAYELANRFFGQVKLDGDVFLNASWLSLTKDSRLRDVPLPPTNSQSAKHMRVAAVLRLLAFAAGEHIFQPAYITEEGGDLGEVLDEAYILDPPRAEWIRRVLLKIEPSTQAANGQARAEAASTDVFRTVGFLLVSSDGSRNEQNNFSSAVQEWCNKAHDHWRRFQMLEPNFTAVFEEKGGLISGEWRRFPDAPTQGGVPANGARPQHGLVVEDIVAQIWPAFAFPTKRAGELELIKRGYVLVKEQVDAASREVASARLSSDRHRRGRSDLKRRMTMTSKSNDSTENLAFLSQKS